MRRAGAQPSPTRSKATPFQGVWCGAQAAGHGCSAAAECLLGHPRYLLASPYSPPRRPLAHCRCSAAPFPPYGSCNNTRSSKAGPSWQSYECKTYRTSVQHMSGELKEGVQQQRFDIAVMLASNT